PEQELAAVRTAREAARRYQALVLVNGSADLTAESGADGLHLGPTEPSARAQRDRIGRFPLIGRTAQSGEQIEAVLADPDLDYFSIGPVHRTPTVPQARPVGLDLVRQAARVAPVADPETKPWFAIGGIDETTIDDVIEAGARRVAVVRAITAA